MACEGFAERAGGVGFGVLFVIFWIRERFSASKRPRKIEECVLNFKHYWEVNAFDEKKR